MSSTQSLARRPIRQHGQRVGDAGPGQRIAGVELDCRPKQDEPRRDARSPPIDQRAAPQIELIRLDIRRSLFDQPIVFATGEGDPQSLCDRLRDLILHVEDVFQLTVTAPTTVESHWPRRSAAR